MARLQVGGTYRQLNALVHGLMARGFRCKIWLADDLGGACTDEIRGHGVAVEGIFSGIGLLGTVTRTVYRVLTVPALALAWRLGRDRPRVLQSFHDENNVIGALAGRLARVPVVAIGLRSLHPRHPSWSGDAHWADIYDRIDPRCVDAVVANSVAGLNAFKAFEPRFSPATLHVVPNCVVPPPRRSSAGLRLPSQAPVILWLARLVPEKRPDVFVAVLRQLRQREIAFEAWVAGDGPEAAELHRLVREADLSSYVRFLGTVIDVGELFFAARLLMLCSDVEGLSNSILEAQFSACPVVATSVGGTPELIVDGVTGFLVPLGDVGAFTQRVAQLLLDADLSRRVGSAARQRVLQHHSMDRMVEETIDVYLRTNARESYGLGIGRALGDR